MKMRTVLILVFVSAMCALPATAQTPAGQVERKVVLDRQMTELAGSLRTAVQARLVRNAPYSAETTTEFVQLLADGNRIVRTTNTRVYRDSEGRTRVEQMNAGIIQRITISDPVAGTSYTLIPDKHVAFQGGFVNVVTTAGGTTTFVTKLSPSMAPDPAKKEAEEMLVRMQREQGVTEARIAVGGAVIASKTGAADKSATTEQLGTQQIEGVEATGSRTTTVIPAGAIGNEQSIRIVSEQWFSNDLQALVLTRHRDPQAGDTTYRMTNIVRAEPDRSLFQVPADYKIEKTMEVKPDVFPKR